MIHLGDCILFTIPPIGLRLTVKTENSKVVDRRMQERLVTITDACLVAGGQEVRSESIGKIVWQLLLHGAWSGPGWEYRAANGLEFMELLVAPEEIDSNRHQMIGALSTIYSNAILSDIAEDAADVSVAAEQFSPGELGRLIPPDFDFHNSELRLVVVRIRPS